MNQLLRDSYAYCSKMARSAASSFYLPLLLLPPAKRRAMLALYVFMRNIDDAGDTPRPLAQKRVAIDAWRDRLAAALAGDFQHRSLPALADAAARFNIPSRYLFEVIDGVEMDLTKNRYATFTELCDYCYHVASAVGLACIHIWGFDGQQAIDPAVKCGQAFQLTNILRDVKEDAARGRIYLPREDLQRFGYSEGDLLASTYDERFRRLMEFEIGRAESLYREAATLEDYLSGDGRRVFGAMTAVYHGLLGEIRRRRGDVFSDRVQLGRWRQLRIAASWFFRRGPRRSAVPVGSGR